MIRLTTFFMLASLLILGCGGTFDRGSEEEIVGDASRVREKTSSKKLNPMGSPEDDDIVPDKYHIAPKTIIDSSFTLDSSINIPHYPGNDFIKNASQVFRVQLFSSNTYGQATAELKIAGEVFDKQVYLDYEVPYYKIRVGDFINRNDAEEYLIAAKEAGYNTAWVVRVALGVQTMENIYEGEDIPPLIDPDTDSPDSILNSPEPEDAEYQYPEN